MQRIESAQLNAPHDDAQTSPTTTAGLSPALATAPHPPQMNTRGSISTSGGANTDPSARYVVRSLLSLLRLSESAKASRYEESLCIHRATTRFLNEPECRILRATLVTDIVDKENSELSSAASSSTSSPTTTTSLKLSNMVSNQVLASPSASVWDAFAVKRTPCSVSTGLEKEVMFIASQGQRPLDTLYTALENVFIPQISIDASPSSAPLASGSFESSIPVKDNSNGYSDSDSIALTSALTEAGHFIQRLISTGDSKKMLSVSKEESYSGSFLDNMSNSIDGERRRWDYIASSPQSQLNSRARQHASFVAESLGRLADPISDIERRSSSVNARIASIIDSAALNAHSKEASADYSSGIAQLATADLEFQLPSPEDLGHILEEIEDSFSGMLEVEWHPQPCIDKISYLKKVSAIVSRSIHSYVRAWLRLTVSIETYHQTSAQMSPDNSKSQFGSTMAMLGITPGSPASTIPAQKVHNTLSGPAGLGTIWSIPYASAKSILSAMIDLITNWINIQASLCRTYCGVSDSNGWKDQTLEIIASRFTAALSYRSLVNELARALPPSVSSQLSDASRMGRLPRAQVLATARVSLETAFTHFANVDLLHVGMIATEQLQKAEHSFYAAIAPIEAAAAELIANRLTALRGRPVALVAECATCVGLLKRPVVAQALSGRLRILVKALSVFGNILRERAIKANVIQKGTSGNDIEALSDPNAATAEDDTKSKTAESASPLVMKLIVIGQLLSQCKALNEAAELLVDAKGNSSQEAGDIRSRELGTIVRKEAHTLISTLLTSQNAIYTHWQTTALEQAQAFSSNTSSGSFSKPLMELDQSQGGKLVVHFDDAMVVMLRDVRYLCELGFSQRLDSRVKRFVMDIQRRFRYAQAVKRASTFYDAFQLTARPSQLGLLLNEAQAFEQAIRSNARVDWQRGGEVEAYLSHLAKAAQALDRRNTSLKTLHDELETTTLSLIGTSIIRSESRWREGIHFMRKIIDSEAKSGQNAQQSLKLWTTHWEHQIWKAVNFQYRYCLETAADTLPPITCELALGRSGAILKPPLYELRSHSFEAVAELVEWPTRFDGLLGSNDSKMSSELRSIVDVSQNASRILYSKIPEIHAKSVFNAYSGVIAQLNALEAVVRRHDSWCTSASMGSEELTELASRTLETAEHWAQNFASHQRLVKNASRLEDSLVVGCFRVSLAGFRSSVEDALARLWTSLVVSLKRNIASTAREIEEFTSEGVTTLSVAPATMDDVADARANWRDLNEKRPIYASKLSSISEKEDLLRQQVGVLNAGTAVNVSLLKQKWDAFDHAHSGFSSMLEDQKESFKENAQNQIKETTRLSDRLVSRWAALRPDIPQDGKSIQDPKAIVDALRSWDEEYLAIEKQMDRFLNAAKQFGLPDPSTEWLPGRTTGQEIREAREAWSVFEKYLDEVNSLASELWIDFRPRLNTFEDLMRKWQVTTRSRPVDKVQELLTSDIKKNIQIFPSLQKVTGESFQRDHWKTLFGKLGMPTDTKLETLRLKDFMNVADVIKAKARDISELASRARGEIMIREAFDEVRAWCARAEFSTIPHTTTSRRSTILIREWRGLFSQISDQVALLGSIKESPFFGPFEEQAVQVESRFGILTNALTNLNEVQRKWLYLEPIFARGALPQEQTRFSRLDSSFRDIMSSIESEPVVMQLTQYPSLLETTESLLDQLERCQRALVAFLTSKRDRFPRFYFVSDDDLLEILGQADNPAVIDSHVKKLFAGLHKLVLKGKQVIGFESSLGERVLLREDDVVEVTQSVEDWLSKLLLSIRHTLHSQIIQCAAELLEAGETVSNDQQISRFDRFASQALCVAEELAFARKVDEVLVSISESKDASSNGLQGLSQSINAKLVQLTSFGASYQDSVLESKLKALVLTVIHHADIVTQLIHSKANSPTSWAWQKELKMLSVDSTGSPSSFTSVFSQLQKLRQAKGEQTANLQFDSEAFRITAVMAGAVQDYSFEYQGNEPKLVHTPLTDKCYLVLMQALRLGQGGNPLGPAGTGKTETVKALGQFVGRQVLVFNCDEGIDFHSMGRIFAGIVKSGAWGCFDEFNRLKEDQLSSISQQIQVIQGALRRGDSAVELLDREVEVNRNAAIFVTLNPASREYGGRSKLPHNLKALFRPVAMSAPDNAQISQVLLYSEGFLSAPVLAKKLVEVFALSKQLLSHQVHYDWGLRALKSVLKQGGLEIALKRKSLGKMAALDSREEAILLVSVLRVNTLSKLTHSDAVRFAGLLEDVFTREITEAAEDPVDPVLERNVEEAFKKLGLRSEPRQLRKVIQLHAASKQRTGIALVGPAGSGKSTLLKVLALALEKMNVDVTSYTMNPKSLDRHRLLGYMDPDTREWYDGVLTNAAKSIVSPESSSSPATNGDNVKSNAPKKSNSWIVCDGDVDPEWIESLNSVLDDNRLLTMPNGARIRFESNVNFIFETHDLSFASPATVSRMGVIALSDEDITTEMIVDSWLDGLKRAAAQSNKLKSESAQATTLHDSPGGSLSKLQDSIIEIIRSTVESVLPNALKIVRTMELAAQVESKGFIKAALSHIEAAFKPILVLSNLPPSLGEPQLRSLCVSSLVYGLGATLLPEQRPDLISNICDWAGLSQNALFSPKSYTGHVTSINDALKNQHQHSRLSNETESSGVFEELDADALPLLIETSEVVESLAILRPWLMSSALTTSQQHLAPVIVIGPEGCGKTRIVKSAVGCMKGATVATLHCNSQTRAVHAIQKLLEVTTMFTTNLGKVLRPKDGNRVVLLLKDINLPAPDKYRTSQIVEFLIQIASHKGFYDENLEWVFVENIQIVATAAPPGTVGRHTLSQRLVSSSRILYVSYPSDKNLVSIYTGLIKSVVGMPTFLGASHSPVFDENEPITNATNSSKLLSSASQIDWTSQQTCSSIAQAMVECYHMFKARFSPDDHRHYVCSPRDLSRWVSGLRKHALSSSSELPGIWAFEGDCVFSDRIVDPESKAKFRLYILQLLKRWGIDATSTLNRVAHNQAVSADSKNQTSSVDSIFQSLVRTSLADPYGEKQSTIATIGKEAEVVLEILEDRARLVGPLLEPSSLQELGEVLVQAKYAYERDFRQLDVVLVSDVISRASRLERTLGAPGGSVLLAGDSGSGKRGLVLLVANMLGYHVVIPKVSAQNASSIDYLSESSAKLFRAELKELVSLAVSPQQAASSATGGSAVATSAAKGCVLVLEDSHLESEKVLQDVNSLLSGGEVPGLFSAAEYESLLSSVRSEWRQSMANASEAGMDSDEGLIRLSSPGVCRTVSEYLARKIQRQVHVALCLNTAHPEFSSRLASNPALLGRCSTIWVGGWSSDTLASVTRRRLLPIVKHMEHELKLRAAAAGTAGKALPAVDPHSLVQIAQYVHQSRARDEFSSDEDTNEQSCVISGKGRAGGVGPAKFVAFIDTYLALFHNKQLFLSRRRSHLQQGLSKLEEASSTVGELREKAREQQALVAAKQNEADLALSRITEAMTVVAGRQQEANELKQALGEEESKLGERRAIVEAELGDVIPILEEAKRKVGTIQREHVNEVRSYSMPPPAISHVLAAVLTLMGNKDLTWNGMKKFLSDSSVKERIIKFDATTLSREARARVQELVNKTPDSFEPKRIASVSSAAAPLAEWTLAQLRYASALETVRPKQLELERADKALENARTRQIEVAEELNRLGDEVKHLRVSFSKTTAEAEALKIGLEKIEQTLSRAGGLLDKLSGERERWSLQVRQLSASLVALPFNSLLAAAAVTYLGGETEGGRAAALEDWREKCRLKRIDFLGFIASEAQRLRWKEDGLGADSLSQQNAGIILASLPMPSQDEHQEKIKGERKAGEGRDSSEGSYEHNEENSVACPLTPYVIDPSGRALTWLTKHLSNIAAHEKQKPGNAHESYGASRDTMGLILDDGDKSFGESAARSGQRSGAQSSKLNFELTTMQNERLLNTLELAVRFGKTIIIQEVDSIPPFMHALIRKDLQRSTGGSGGRSVVQIGEKLVEYHPRFSLVLFTRDSSPQVPSVLASSLCIVSFSSTRAGLEQALLASTLSIEHPELEEKLSELLAQEEKLNDSLTKLEDELLQTLTEAEGNLLDNENLVTRLDATKSQAQTIEQSLLKSKEVQSTLAEQRGSYQSIAELGATLYFLIVKLVSVNNMYCFSLSGFMDIFTMNHVELMKRLQEIGRISKDVTGSGLAPSEFVPMLCEHLTKNVYAHVSRALFKQDHLMFAMHLMRGVRPDLVPEALWRYFLGQTGLATSNGSDNLKFQVPSWVPPANHSKLQKLVECYPAVVQRFEISEGASSWVSWLAQASSDLGESCASNMPSAGNISSPGDDFLRLALISAIKPELVLQCATKLVREALLLNSLAPPTLSFSELVHEAKGTKPILFLTAAGADPSFEIETFAEKYFAEQKESAGAPKQTSFEQLAMGSGQTEAATKLIVSSLKQGGWVLLKNIHLVVSWLPSLEKLLSSTNSHHSDFRLWLTAEEHLSFPSLLLQRCVKVAYEAPPGVRQNMLRSFSGWDREYLSLGRSGLRGQILFCLVAMHAVLQERRSFVPQGWLKAHEFTQTDLRSAADIVDMCFSEAALESIALSNPGLAAKILSLASNRNVKASSHTQNSSLHLRLKSSLYLPVDISSSTQAIKELYSQNIAVSVDSLSWNAIWSILRTAVYGGRLDSEQDIRILTTYLRKFLAQDLLSTTQQPTPKRRPLFGLKGDMPHSFDPQDFLQLIESLPETDAPAVFDLPSNAGATLGAQRAVALANSLRGLSQSATINEGFNRKVWKSSLEPLIWRWRQLSSTMQISRFGSASAVSMGALQRHASDWSPIEAFFQLEFNFAATMIDKVNTTLEGLASVLLPQQDAQSVAPVINLNRRLEVEGAALISGNVPQSWLSVGPGGWWPTTPEGCLNSLTHKFSGLLACIKLLNNEGKGGSDSSMKLLSRPLLLSYLFRPRTFLDALRQYTARISGSPIDSLKLVASWSPSHLPTGASQVRAQIEGMLLQGASLRQIAQGQPLLLTDVGSSSPAFERVPVFTIAFVPQSDPDPYAVSGGVCTVPGVMPVPVYDDTSRESLVCELKVPISGRLPKWILAGVAFALSPLE